MSWFRFGPREPGEIAGDPRVKTRRAAAGQPGNAAEVLSLLARDQDAGVRQAVAENPSTPREALMLLVGDDSETVRCVAMDRYVATTPVTARLEAASNRETAAELLVALSADPDADVREAVARHHRTPPTTKAVLSQDLVPAVRRAVASGWGLIPDELLVDLTHDVDPSVRQAVAARWNVPDECLRNLCLDRNVAVRIALAERCDPNPEICRILAHDMEVEVRRALAGRAYEHRRHGRGPSATPPDVLAVLASDADVEVRRLVARDLDTPGAVLTVLAQDDDRTVRLAVAESLRATGPALAILADDWDQFIRWAVVKNVERASPICREGVEANVLAVLAAVPNAEVRRAVAGNSHTPEAVITQLTKDQDAGVARAAALQVAGRESTRTHRWGR